MQDPGGLGPVSYLIVEFPGSRMTGQGFPLLLDLVERGLIRILDFRFIARTRDGDVQVMNWSDIGGTAAFDFGVFEGVSSGLLDEGDLADACAVVEPGSSAAILIFENRWAAPLTRALRGGGAELVAAGYIPHETLNASLEAAEAASN